MRSCLCTGFSFAEVMFAVVILGIGFIMVSTVFPVAVEQTRSTCDEAIAANLARDAIKTITSSVSIDDFPLDSNNDGVTRPFYDIPALWNKFSGSVIDPVDPRYAWIPFFSRSQTDGLVHISVLVVRRWMRDAYTPADLDGELMPRGINIIAVAPAANNSSIVQISRDKAGMYQSVTDGSILIMRSAIKGDTPGRCFHIDRLVAQDSESVSFSLVPGGNLTADESCDNTAAAVIGRDYADHFDADHPAYIGPSQDVAVYTTIISPN